MNYLLSCLLFVVLSFPGETGLLVSQMGWELRPGEEEWTVFYSSLGQEDSPGGENGNPLQYSYLENPTDKEASQAPRGHKESDMAERLHTHISCYLSLPLTRILTLQVKFLFFRE